MWNLTIPIEAKAPSRERSTMNAAHKITATADNFMNDVVEASKTTPVLVDFWAEWCGPCKQLMPTLDRLADEYNGRFVLAKVNTDEQQALASQVGVRSLPTVVLFKAGQVVDHFVGAVPESHVRQMLDKHVPARQATPLEVARESKSRGDYVSARLALDQALAQRPESIEAQCGLAEIDILEGKLDAAKERIAQLQGREPNAAPVKRAMALLEFGDVMREHPDAAAIRQRLSADPNDADARHALAVHRLLAGDYDAALADWLELMRTHRRYRDDLARKSLLQAFELIGNADPRVAQTRRAMAQMLF